VVEIRRRWIRWLVKAIKKDTVVPNQILFYALMVVNGLYNSLAVDVPSQVLEESLTDHQYLFFVWMATIAPLLTIIGKTFKRSWAQTGCVLQLVGDIGVCGACTTFCVAVGYTQWWGQGNFATVFVFASALGSSLFIARDALLLAERGRWVPVK
jgi:hypothetical protein